LYVTWWVLSERVTVPNVLVTPLPAVGLVPEATTRGGQMGRQEAWHTTCDGLSVLKAYSVKPEGATSTWPRAVEPTRTVGVAAGRVAAAALQPAAASARKGRVNRTRRFDRRMRERGPVGKFDMPKTTCRPRRSFSGSVPAKDNDP